MNQNDFFYTATPGQMQQPQYQSYQQPIQQQQNQGSFTQAIVNSNQMPGVNPGMGPKSIQDDTGHPHPGMYMIDSKKHIRMYIGFGILMFIIGFILGAKFWFKIYIIWSIITGG